MSISTLTWTLSYDILTKGILVYSTSRIAFVKEPQPKWHTPECLMMVLKISSIRIDLYHVKQLNFDTFVLDTKCRCWCSNAVFLVTSFFAVKKKQIMVRLRLNMYLFAYLFNSRNASVRKLKFKMLNLRPRVTAALQWVFISRYSAESMTHFFIWIFKIEGLNLGCAESLNCPRAISITIP